MEPIVCMQILDCCFYLFLDTQQASVTNIFHELFFDDRQKLVLSAFEIQDFLSAVHYEDGFCNGCVF